MAEKDRAAPHIPLARLRQDAQPHQDVLPTPAAVANATFVAERLASPEALLAIAEQLGNDATALPFQRRAWLAPWYANLAADAACTPCPIAVRCEAGRVAVLLALVIRRRGALRVLEPADAGLSDYNAPILGPAAPTDPPGATRLWRSIQRLALPADVVRLDKMPTVIHGRPNPLALLSGASPSPLFGSLIEIGDDFEAFLRARGKHFRKEVNRSFRVLEREGPWGFMAPDDVAGAHRILDVLEEHQSARIAGTGKTYLLDAAPVRAHYREVLALGLADGTARIFALTVNGEIIASVFGLVDRDRFLLLRIANAGDAWKHCSPGRLIIAEAMRWMMARGINTLDMTIGDYPFKRQFDPVAVPLVDLHLALGWRGWAAAAKARAKARARQSPLLVRLARSLRQG